MQPRHTQCHACSRAGRPSAVARRKTPCVGAPTQDSILPTSRARTRVLLRADWERTVNRVYCSPSQAARKTR